MPEWPDKVSEVIADSKIREARDADMISVYMMGYDAWGDGNPPPMYLEQCAASTKYKKGRWYVLADNRDNAVSSLLVHKLADTVAGIGSIATPPELRNRGLATRLILDVLESLNQTGVEIVYLFSDISPEFYGRLGFTSLPKEFQRYQESTCMVWGRPVAEVTRTPGYSAPTYF